MEYVSQQNMNMRPAPNVNNSPIKSIPAGTKVPVLETYEYANGDKWAKVTFQTVTGWVAVIHLGKVYGEIITPPTEPPGIPDYFDLTAPDGTVTRYVKA